MEHQWWRQPEVAADVHRALEHANDARESSSSGRGSERRPHRGHKLDVPVSTRVTATAEPSFEQIRHWDVLGGLIHEYQVAA